MGKSNKDLQEEVAKMYEDPKKAIGEAIDDILAREVNGIDPQILQNYVMAAKMKKMQSTSQAQSSSNTAASFTGGSWTATQAASAANPWTTSTGGRGYQSYAPYTTSGNSIPFSPPYVTMPQVGGQDVFGYTKDYTGTIQGAVFNIVEDLKDWYSIGFIGGLMRYVWYKDKHSGGKHLLSLGFFDMIMMRLVTVPNLHNDKAIKEWGAGEIIEMIEDNSNLVLERKFKNSHDVLKYFFTRELGEDAGIWKIAENL